MNRIYWVKEEGKRMQGGKRNAKSRRPSLGKKMSRLTTQLKSRMNRQKSQQCSMNQQMKELVDEKLL